MAQLDKISPTNDCSICILAPKLLECYGYENVKVLSYSEVVEVKGHLGDFKVKSRKKARYIDVDKCNSCNVCLNSCPVRYVPQVERAMEEASGKPMPSRESDQSLKPSQDGEAISSNPANKVAPLKFYHAYLARAIFVVDFKVNGQEVTNFLTALKWSRGGKLACSMAI